MAYIRVSTREQDENVQKHAIKEFASTRGIEIKEWFIDKGESGAKPFEQRPSAQLLIEYIKRNKVEAVLVFAIDRIGRSMIDTMQTIIRLENEGVRVISVKEEWMQVVDPNLRKLILAIFSWVAEFERKRIRERQLEAWEMGKQKGRPPKVRDETIERYLRRYPMLKLKAIWKIMSRDGVDISYETLRRRVRELNYAWKGEWIKIK